jgi:hypothetical protein
VFFTTNGEGYKEFREEAHLTKREIANLHGFFGTQSVEQCLNFFKRIATNFAVKISKLT